MFSYGLIPERTILLLILLAAMECVWILEQPISSLITRHRRFQWLIRHWEALGVRATEWYKRKCLGCFFPSGEYINWVNKRVYTHSFTIQFLQIKNIFWVTKYVHHRV